MSITVALKLLEQPLVDQRPYLHFGPLNSLIFQRLVPDAEPAPGVKTGYSGSTFKLPTVLPAGRSLGTILDRCLPGFLHHAPYGGYVTLEATDEQLATLTEMTTSARFYAGADAYFCAQGYWWRFPFMQGTIRVSMTQLETTHDLYYVDPPAGWKAPALAVVGDLEYWLAVGGNYGTERKRAGSRSVSALKMTKEAMNTIDFLFHAQIVDLTTPRSSYRYIDFSASDILRHKDAHFFYFKVSGRDLQLLETLTKRQLETRCYIWLNNAWCMMPSAMGLYAKGIGGEYPYRPVDQSRAPHYDPPGVARPLGSGSTNTIRRRGKNITATYSEMEPGQPGWWWIKGDFEAATKSIRTELRSLGCDWSKRRQAWYFKGRTLPAPLLKLLGIQEDPAANPMPTIPAATTLRANPLDLDQPTLPPARHFNNFTGTDLTQQEYQTMKQAERNADPLQDADGNPLANPQPNLQPPPAPHYDPFTPDEVAKLLSNDISEQKRLNLLISRYHTDQERAKPSAAKEDPVASPQAPPSSTAEQNTLTASADPSTTVNHVATTPLSAPVKSVTAAFQAAPALPQETVEPEKPPSMTILTAAALLTGSSNPVLLKAAIDSAARAPAQTVLTDKIGQANKHSAQAIPQDYLGELTGSVAGDVHCYGYALDNGICIWVNLGGPRMAVEAIRAKLSRGDLVNLTPWDGPAVELTAGEGHSSQYTDCFANMSEHKFCNLILIHKALTEPLYDGKFTTYVLAAHDTTAINKVYEHLQQLVNIPVFPEWRHLLWQAGHTALLIRRIQAAGGLQAFSLNLDTDEWTRLIAGCVQEGTLTFPPQSKDSPNNPSPTSNE
ncbi:MAG: hypothetical protein ABI700_01335 [Chloroflexota bacterium]